MKSIYWTPDRTETYNRYLNFIIGVRGTGKTYGCLNKAIKRVVRELEGKTHKGYVPEWVYMRRYESELETIEKVLNPIFNKEKYLSNYEFKQEKRDFYIRRKPEKLINEKGKEYIENTPWIVMGHWLALSTSSHFKGTSYENVDTLIYDEFLYEKSDRSKELKREVDKFFNVLETIFRNREGWRVFLLGNATTFETCYKYELKLMTPYNSNIWCSKTKSILVEIVANPEYIKAKKNSPIGKLASGTSYESYAIDNNFIYDSNTFIKRKKGNYRRMCVFEYENHKYGIFIKKGQNEIIIDTVKRTDTEPIRFTFKSEYMSEQAKSILTRNHPIFKLLRTYFNNNKVYYQNIRVKSFIYPLFLKNF